MKSQAKKDFLSISSYKQKASWADTKSVTYPWNLGMFSMQDPNTPYVKDEFDSLQQAQGSFNTAVSGNYTAVIWDSSDKKPVQAYHSSVDGGLGSHIVAGLATAGVAGASIAGGIITFGAAGSAASTV
eukprot:TRINITY_DN8313_c0_g1_i1.p1 TRINITY_DN8313_c0_g1~~TRINITY_DN8313_c0_g1_i1.p1  ORF type:complete len:128 (+),score=26.78 TRINITY_DN8313_c0_g1_i1:1050-1433(+)